MRYSSRFFLYAPLALFLALAGWAMAHWWIVAAAFDKKLTALNGHEAVPGVTFSYTSKTISGFPFNIDVVFAGFKVSGAGAHGPFAWSSEHFALHTLTYGPEKYIFEAAGQQALAWTDGAGVMHRAVFLPGSLRASSLADDRGLARFDLDLVAAAGKNFTAAHFQFHLRRDPQADALDLMVSADAAKAPGLQIHTLSDYLTLDPGKPFAPLLAGVQSWSDAAAAWRKAGGMARPGKREITPAEDASAIDRVLTSLY